MAFFQTLDASASYDNYIESLMAGNSESKYIGLRSLKNSDVLTAVSIVAGDIARFPIIRKTTTDQFIDDQEIHYLLNVESTRNASARSWRFAMAVNAILCGNSYSRIIRDPKTDKPLEFIFYRPSETTITEKSNRELIYTFYDSHLSKEISCLPEDVIHWKFFTTDTILGRSPLLSLNEEISLQENGVTTLLKFFRDGFSSGIIKLKGSQLNGESRRKAREDFETMRKNATGGSPLVFDDTQEYTPLEIDTNVLQLITSNNYSTAQIAKALRVPAYKLGVNSPNQSVAQLNRDYTMNDLVYYFDAITSELAMKLLSFEEKKNTIFKFDTRDITGIPVEDVIKLVNNGLLTANGGLVELGKQKSNDPNMDRMQSSLNTVFLDKKEEYQKNNKKGMKGGGENKED